MVSGEVRVCGSKYNFLWIEQLYLRTFLVDDNSTSNKGRWRHLNEAPRGFVVNSFVNYKLVVRFEICHHHHHHHHRWKCWLQNWKLTSAIWKFQGNSIFVFHCWTLVHLSCICTMYKNVVFVLFKFNWQSGEDEIRWSNLKMSINNRCCFASDLVRAALGKFNLSQSCFQHSHLPCRGRL